MTKNEVEKLCESAPKGFLFNCAKSHVNHSIPLSAAEAAELPVWCGNEDQLFVKCKTCDLLMIFTGESSDALDGKWACPECGRVVREATPYKVLDMENRAFEKRWLKQE